MTLSTHRTNVPIISEDIFGWVREGNALQVRVWLDDTEHDLNQGCVKRVHMSPNTHVRVQ
jgi:hypothetical protein